MDFAPYRETIPSAAAAAAQESQAQAASSSKKQSAWFAAPSSSSYQSGANIDSLDGKTQSSSSSANAAQYQSMGGQNQQTSSTGPEAFVTRFGWRVDMEAAAAYIAGPVLAILLLMVETHNSYVRFHAYQSLLLSACLAIIHVLLLWSTTLGRAMLLLDVVVLWYLAFNAFRDSDTLYRRQIPRLGEYANAWVEEE